MFINYLLYKILNQVEIKFLIISAAVAVTAFIVNGIKMIFGRYWADTFMCNNLSLLHNNVYGFNWFNSQDINQSFPSGTVALITAFSVSMMVFFQNLGG